MNLNYFTDLNLANSITQFFKGRAIVFNQVSSEAIKKKDFFETVVDPNVNYLSPLDTIYFPLVISGSDFSNTLFDETITHKTIKEDYEGIFVFGIKLQKQPKKIPLSDLANITRAVSREIKNNPVVVFFLMDGKLSIANCERTPYKRDREGEKPGKVSILRDIDLENPHTGHIRILEDMNIANKGINSFRELNAHWTNVFDTKTLNKKFYQEIFYWYLWASKEAEFPNLKIPTGGGRKKEKYFTEENDIKNHTSVSLIRLLTRLIFVWFLKEKSIIPESLFQEKDLKNILKSFSSQGKKLPFTKQFYKTFSLQL